jgi:hypothetical protein
MNKLYDVIDDIYEYVENEPELDRNDLLYKLSMLEEVYFRVQNKYEEMTRILNCNNE